MKRIGLMGGTFDPPHIAHSIVAECVREQLQLDKILFIPSGNPPLKESISADHRLEMAKLAFGNDKHFEVSEMETNDINGKSYTVNTLEKLNKHYEDDPVKFLLIIGVDNLIELPKWKDPHRLFELSEVVVINRPDYSVKNSSPEFIDKVRFVSVPYLEISSSSIRDHVKSGRSIKYLVNEKVEEYIAKNKLYQ